MMLNLFLSWHPTLQVAFIIGCLFVLATLIGDLFETAAYWSAVSRINTDCFCGENNDVSDAAPDA